MSEALSVLSQALCRKTGAATPSLAVRRLLNSVLLAADEAHPPVRVRNLLDVLNVPFDYSDEGIHDAEAAVRVVNGQLRLQIPESRIRRDRNSRRWRFSIAHEFIHILLIKSLGPKIIDVTNTDKETYDFVERLCDEGASHLLIPRSYLKTELRRGGLRRETIEKVATECDVSLSAAIRSVNDLLPGGSIFFLSRFKRGKRGHEKLRVRWCTASNRDVAARPWVAKGCSLKHLGTNDETVSNALATGATLKLDASFAGYSWKLDAVPILWPYLPNDRLDLGDGEKGGFQQGCPPDRDACAIVCSKAGFLDDSLLSRTTTA